MLNEAKIWILEAVLAVVCVVSTVRHSFSYRDDTVGVVSLIFQSAIREEMKHDTEPFIIHYNSTDSPNDLSSEERILWMKQYCYTSLDSTRHCLDSLFQKEVTAMKIPGETALTVVQNGKILHSASEFYQQKAIALPPQTFRKDYKKTTDIVLQPYLYLSFWDYLLLPLNLLILSVWVLVGAGILIYYKKIKRRVVPVIPVVKEEIKVPEPPVSRKKRVVEKHWNYTFPNGVLYDEKQGFLKRGDEEFEIKGNVQKYLLAALVHAGDAGLNYDEIYQRVYMEGMKDPACVDSDSARRKIQAAVKRLRADLKPVGGIEVEFSMEDKRYFIIWGNFALLEETAE